MAARDYGQYCGVTRALELVGERWALLIVRDLLVGPRRYGELAAGLPRIPSNILAARLKELQAAGVLRRAPRSRVIIYELTESVERAMKGLLAPIYEEFPLGKAEVRATFRTPKGIIIAGCIETIVVRLKGITTALQDKR